MKKLVLPVLAFAALAAVGTFHAWAHSRVAQSGYELARLEVDHRRLIAERDHLRLEVATLRAPGRLEQFARTRLGMASPASGAVIPVGPARVVAARRPPSGGIPTPALAEAHRP